jgi:Protein of unknown function (DUF2612)
MIDVEQTIISQYGNSPILLQLIKNMNEYIDPRADIDNFYNSVFNINTAKSFALDIWGRIVGIDRLLTIPADIKYFGFNNSGREPFNSAPFYNGDNVTQTYSLTDDAYRRLILFKALSNITQSTAPALNQLISKLFEGRGRCFVQDDGNMHIHYVFEFTLTNVEMAILTHSNITPKPAGVAVEFYQIVNKKYFGFYGSNGSPFNQYPFFSEVNEIATD